MRAAIIRQLGPPSVIAIDEVTHPSPSEGEILVRIAAAGVGLFDAGKLVAQVGTILPLEEVRAAHEMLAGAPHNRGKIVPKIAP